MHGILREACDLRRKRCRIDLAGRTGHGNKAGGAGEKFRCAAFILDDMGLRMTEGDAAGALDAGERKGIRSRTGRDKEDGDFALEDLGKACLDFFIEIAGAVCGREAGGSCEQPLGNKIHGRQPSCRKQNTWKNR